mmetsp:Transcript_32160/g.67043  ORF Transcript_32160/g.67043 Transcript_32160/m.67043 type:complete len:373 (-) Transcript_32160:255-1373(-)|eukprot:CAMPEP_0172456710 /NCGR_PEP_ID=MMETSP1065-20121228/17428_1 /TAXON_ID=265537 /ORGANISM="Amphiprora paludosa, Strain CCMP125" /LENGTH=372 /DNA_ID=CAMNT_0013209923 /DNA_START=63 /DNA_END=1181 /DNA_ORIENTATION=-
MTRRRKMMRLIVILAAKVLVLLTSTVEATVDEEERQVKRRLGENKVKRSRNGVLSDEERQFAFLDNRNVDLSHRELSNGNISPSFAKCWDHLLQSSSNGKELTSEDYVNFLRELTDGELDAGSFKNLELEYVSIFYSTACRFDRPCVGDSASIELESSGPAFNDLVGFCYGIMQRATTNVDFSFQVTVQFDPETVPRDRIGECLESAVQSTLYDSVGCATIDNNRRLHGQSQQNKHVAKHGSDLTSSVHVELPQSDDKESSPTDPKGLDDSLFWNDPSLLSWPIKGIASQTTNRQLQTCPYDITTTLSAGNSFFVGCLKEPGLCGTAVLQVHASASQLLAPYRDQLQHDATKALEQAVDRETFGDYFPPFCV